MQSYFECIEELDAVAAEVHRDHAEPDHAIQLGGLALDYGMTQGRLLYRPETVPSVGEPALEFTASNDQYGFHRYSLSREHKLVIVQFSGVTLQKSEIRKPRAHDNIHSSPELGRMAERMPFSILTVTGLRRLTSDMAKFKQKSDSLAQQKQAATISKSSKLIH